MALGPAFHATASIHPRRDYGDLRSDMVQLMAAYIFFCPLLSEVEGLI